MHPIPQIPKMSDYRLSVKEIGMLKEGGWPQWSRKVKGALRLHGTWSYMVGPSSDPPKNATDLIAWASANDCIVGALCGVIEDSLVQEVEKLTTTKEAWMYLKSKTHQGGIISKLTALQDAICTRITSAASINPTLADIKEEIANVYDKGAPTREEWTIVILLQALADGKFDWLRKQFITVMTKKDSNLTSEDIIKRLEAEASEARANETLVSQEAAMAAKFKKSSPSRNKPKPKCTNCQAKGHSNETCWEKGGATEGKAPEWWNELKKKKSGGEKKKCKKANAAVEKGDSSGSDSCAAFIDCITTATATASKFAPPLILNKLCFSNHPSDGDISCVAVNHTDMREKCSIEWNSSTTRNVSVTPTDICLILAIEYVNIATPEDPFYIDSGATSHCSPHCADFLELIPIPPRKINGINGTSIAAIGRGKIVIRLGKGRKLILMEALYVPQAAL
jgi:hypothetical protein